MGGPVLVCLAAVMMSATGASSGASDHWSRPATPERRQGDWVPLSCATPNCRPLVDQGVQSTDSLPSVLTPPPRLEEARLLPPPPPPDGLFQTAASGFLQAFTQQQPPRKPLQFLQETTAQSNNRPQAQFLKSHGPVGKQQQFLQEPSADFTPPQEPRQQQPLVPFNQQQYLSDQPYLNQPLFIGPQFLAAPFFPQTSIPPQNIQPISPVQVQPQAPIAPNVPKQHFQVPADRPVFLQQITAGGPQDPPSAPQQLPQAFLSQQQYSVNNTGNEANEEDKEEVQLLYVPVETLNRARNLGRPKNIAQGTQQQVVAATETNAFTRPSQNFEFSTARPNTDEQDSFNAQTQTSKYQYNANQNVQFQQQLPPEDQEKFNTQTYTVAQQFNLKPQNEQFQQAPLESSASFKTKPTKQQYNFKLNDQYQQQISQDQANFQQPGQFQRLPELDNQGVSGLEKNLRQQHFREQNFPQQDQSQINAQIVNQQFTTQQSAGGFQQVAPEQQQRFQQQAVPVEQQRFQQQAASVDKQRFQQQAIPEEQQQFQQQAIPEEQQQFQQQAIPEEQQQFQQQAIPEEQQQFQQQAIPEEHQQFQQQTIPEEQHQFQQQGIPVEQQSFQQQAVPLKQQRFQQQVVPLEQQRFQEQDVRVAQSQLGQRELSNHQTSALRQQHQINQHTFETAATIKDQPYMNQPIQFNQQISNKVQESTQMLSAPQTYHQQQFNQPEEQTVAPVTQTRLPEVHSTQKPKKQRFRNSQDSIKNLQQQNNQFTKQFPKDYRQPASVDTSAQLIDPLEQAYNLRQQQDQTWKQQEQKQLNQDIADTKHATNFQSDYHRGSSVAPPSSTHAPPPQTTLAPNQPPLSVYMETTEDTKVNDVLRLLKNAETIQVLDTVGPESPQVFVGPSNLKAPTGYIKFELPYLNAIENNNRVERKVDKLPFFVAPLNFNPPPGYSKIPFPAPHIGSVVVSNVTVLKTALHEKPYEYHQIGVSTTERFRDQYTLPAEIPPISPQLPSLINSLQDEIYSGSSTTNFPTTTPEATTAPYTTPAYRGRGSSRGSHRGSVTSVSPSRRPQARTRRPYDGQPYSRRRTTSTTTPEPSSEVPVQQFTSQPETLSHNTDAYTTQNTAASLQEQTVDNQQHFQPENAAAYYNEQFLANNYNQFPSQPHQSNTADHNAKAGGVETVEGLNQYHQIEDSTPNFATDTVAQTTAVPEQNRPEVHHEDQTFTSQRTAGSRRDPTKQHQRFRGRQRLTTTTEQYESPIQQEPQFNPQLAHQFNQQPDSRINYQNPPRRVNLDNHRLVENTHFTASIPSNRFNIQTERADVAFQTTERQFVAQNEEQFVQKNVNKESQHESQFIPQLQDTNSQRQLQLQYQSEQPQENVNYNLEQSTNNQKTQGQFAYTPQISQSTLSPAIQFQQENNQREVLDQNSNPQLQAHFHQVNADNIDQVGNNQAQQNYFNQQNKQTQDNHQIVQQEQENAQGSFNANDGKLFQYTQEQAREPIAKQEEHITQNDQITEFPQNVPQQIPILTTQTELVPQADEEAKVPQYNQQQLVKNNRQQNRGQFEPSSINDEHIRHQQGSGQQYFESNSQIPEVSTTEAATTRASLVRVRGRVRGRQRASTRTHQSTTTEEPNYPTTYLKKQRTNQERDDNQQDYTARKRINYNRQSARNPYKEDKNIPDSNYANTEKQPTSERFSESYDVSSSTSEAPTTIKGRRYQHILNRNKIRRTRPTNSPSTAGSSGTTRFQTPTSSPPVTRLPVTRGRIRKPFSTTTTTTEYPEVSPKWTDQDNFAPSAGSNEILEPLYQTKDKTKEQPSYGFLRPPVIQPKSVPKEVPPPENQDDYWNQAVTIQQSTSFDFRADPAAVTPPSFGTNDQNEGISSIWNGQVELQDGQFYDVFNQQQQTSKHANDQTPFSSDQQKVVYKEVKNRKSTGKENQYTEKTYETKRPSVVLEEEEEEEETEKDKVYPVYREIIKPAESIQDEAQSQVAEDSYPVEGKGYVKDFIEYSEQSTKGFPSQDELVQGDESEIKEGALKRKIATTNAGKKGLRRRGQWVRVRVRKPQDSLETAESQNLAVHSENAIQAVTKAVGEKVSWTPEPSTTTTELPQTTTEIPTVSEPAETINFEEALKDMLKEFITNPDDKEEEVTEVNPNIPGDVTNTTLKAEEVKSADEPHQLREDPENQSLQQEVRIEQDEDRQNYEKQEYIGKTLIPEITTETLTQEATTIFQTIENAETTIEPEVTTNSNEQAYNSQHSRVLGTSTTTEISLETEICYRGRCVKTKKLGGDSDLLPME